MFEEGVCLGECGCRTELVEDASGVSEYWCGFAGSSEDEKAAALALEGEGVFGNDTELLPAGGGVGIGLGGGVTACTIAKVRPVMCAISSSVQLLARAAWIAESLL